MSLTLVIVHMKQFNGVYRRMWKDLGMTFSDIMI